MSTSVLIMLLIGGFILLVLLNDAIRQGAAILLVIILAFALGWFWPRPSTASRLPGAQASTPCVSSF